MCCLRNTNKIKIHKTVLKRDTENESEKMSCREKDKKKKVYLFTNIKVFTVKTFRTILII